MPQNIKEVIKLGLDWDNLVTVRAGGKLIFRSSKSLEESMLGDPNVSEAYKKMQRN